MKKPMSVAQKIAWFVGRGGGLPKGVSRAQAVMIVGLLEETNTAWDYSQARSFLTSYGASDLIKSLLTTKELGGAAARDAINKKSDDDRFQQEVLESLEELKGRDPAAYEARIANRIKRGLWVP